MIPLGVLAARRPAAGGGVLFSDPFTTAGALSATYDTAVFDKTTAGTISGSGTVAFGSAAGSGYATIPSFSHADVDVSIFGAGNDWIRKHWLLAARVQPGYTLSGLTSGAVISSGYELKVENDATNQIRLCRNGASVATSPFSPFSEFGMRLRVVGADIKVRVWLTSGAEPGTWTIEYTDPSPLSAGTCGFGVYNSLNRPATMNAPFVVEDA